MSINKHRYEISQVNPRKKLVKHSIEVGDLKNDNKNRIGTQENQISREVVLRLIAWFEKL